MCYKSNENTICAAVIAQLTTETTMNILHNQPSPQGTPLQTIRQVASGTALPLAPPECRDDAPC
jgi:hypothetical protein